MNRGPLTTCRLLMLALGFAVLYAPVHAKGTDEANEEPGVAEQTSAYIRDYLSDPRRVGTLAGSILGSALTAHPAGSVVGSLIGFLVGKQSMFNEDDARDRRTALATARRDIVPAEGATSLPVLSFSNPQEITFEPSLQAPSIASVPSPAAQPTAAVESVTSAPTSTSAPAVYMPTPAALPAPAVAVGPRGAVSTGAATSPPSWPTALPASPAAVSSSDASVLAMPAPPVATPPAVPLMIAAICGGSIRAVDARLRSLCFYHQAD